MKGTPKELQWFDYTPALAVASAVAARAKSLQMRPARGIRCFQHARGAILVAALLSCALMSAALALPDLPSAGLIANVTCVNDPTESYALYLPSSYAVSKRWPIIYLFDPAGHGSRPVEMYRDLAEQYGFILAGSNNSHNFSNDEAKNLKAIWDDTHARISLDERRTYTSGFSGGARVAGLMAVTCPSCQIAGVIAHGAGYPGTKPPASQKLLYFFAVGDQDFNWPEVVSVRREREEQGLPYRVRVFNGQHQWAPPDVMADAITWMVLKSMQSGDVPRDNTFIDRLFQQRQADAEQAQKANDALGQFAAYRCLVSDFSGLRDANEFPAKLSIFAKSEALKAALKAERDQVEEQLALERAIAPKLEAYTAGAEPDPSALRAEILQAIASLSEQAQHAKKELKRLVASRAFTDLWVSGIENGQQELEARHFEKAEAVFELMGQVKNDPWPMLLLAETHAVMGNKKLALRDLREAIRRGLKDTAAIQGESRLQSLRPEPEFQKLLLDLGNK